MINMFKNSAFNPKPLQQQKVLYMYGQTFQREFALNKKNEFDRKHC